MLQQTTPLRTQGLGLRQRTASGLTLIEILSAVFVLSMGLILVAAAFPVGVQQSEMMRQDTETSLLAGEVMDMLRAHTFSRRMSAEAFDPSPPLTPPQNLARSFIGASSTDPAGTPLWYMVRNSNRAAYDLSTYYGPDSEMIPPRNGDWVCHPFLTRLSRGNWHSNSTHRVAFEDYEVPLYRVTMVIRRHRTDIPQLHDHITLAGANNDTGVLSIPANRIAGIHVGDTIMDRRNGYCYTIRAKDGNQVTLTEKPYVNFTGNTEIVVLGPAATVYYALLGH